MGKPSKQKPKQTEPSSFSFYLLKGEALAYPRGTITPNRCPYLVQASPTTLTPEVLREWFLQSVVPLVGPDAADDLRQLLAEAEKVGADSVSRFFKDAINFRESLE